MRKINQETIEENKERLIFLDVNKEKKKIILILII